MTQSRTMSILLEAICPKNGYFFPLFLGRNDQNLQDKNLDYPENDILNWVSQITGNYDKNHHHTFAALFW